MIYTTFAQLYDQLFDSEMYENWLKYFQNFKFNKESNVLDLACGSGRFTVQLLEKGYRVEGFDLSEEMLSIADYHARNKGLALNLIQGNMLDLSELEKYDVITCFADSLCYLEDIQQIEEVFKQVYEHLLDNGVFLFDVISPFKTDIVYPGYMYNYVDDEQIFVWTSYEGSQEHSVEHDLTFLIKNEAGTYNRLSELHHERTYPIEKYQAALKKAGFKNVTVTSDFGNKEAQKNDERWFFECRK